VSAEEGQEEDQALGELFELRSLHDVRSTLNLGDGVDGGDGEKVTLIFGTVVYDIDHDSLIPLIGIILRRSLVSSQDISWQSIIFFWQ
jgi:hypothetical protein